MTVAGVSGNKGTQKTNQKNTFSKDYQAKQEALAAQIKPQAENISDLKNAKNIKEKQIKLAEQNGDVELARTLREELKRIEQDIQKKETSVFDEKENK